MARTCRFVHLMALVPISAALLAACGDGGGDQPQTATTSVPTTTTPSTPATPTATPPPSTPSNTPPQISGTPLNSVLQGNSFSFRPTAADADGNTLSFSIGNKPGWATFSSSTGRLSGTPTAADVGVYSNITITVSDGQASVSLAPFAITVVAVTVATGSATLSWTPPTQNTDGSPLTNLTGYRVYWGTNQGNYTNSVLLSNPGLATYVVEQLTPATWFFVVTAVSSTGIESSFSNAASKTIP